VQKVAERALLPVLRESTIPYWFIVGVEHYWQEYTGIMEHKRSIIDRNGLPKALR